MVNCKPDVVWQHKTTQSVLESLSYLDATLNLTATSPVNFGMYNQKGGEAAPSCSLPQVANVSNCLSNRPSLLYSRQVSELQIPQKKYSSFPPPHPAGVAKLVVSAGQPSHC